jgi:predicted nucleic acid-binding protein
VIYLDTSVLLAELFAEDRKPPRSLWTEPLVSSRLLDYEAWTRTHALGRAETHGERLVEWLSRVNFVELLPEVLMRARETFPQPVRTLDAMHLSTLCFLKERGVKELQLATYDHRLAAVATQLNLRCASV